MPRWTLISLTVPASGPARKIARFTVPINFEGALTENLSYQQYVFEFMVEAAFFH
jgi:hypothetical protein